MASLTSPALAVPDQSNLDQLLAVISEGMDQVNDLSDAELDGAKRHSIAPFLGEVMLGHLQLMAPTADIPKTIAIRCTDEATADLEV